MKKSTSTTTTTTTTTTITTITTTTTSTAINTATTYGKAKDYPRRICSYIIHYRRENSCIKEQIKDEYDDDDDHHINDSMMIITILKVQR